MFKKNRKHTKENEMDLKRPTLKKHDPLPSKFEISISKRTIKKYHYTLTDYEANLIYASYENQIWNLNLDLGSFEVMHGIARASTLIADKLNIAFEINLEKLQNPTDDGSFLIDILLDLFIFYKNLLYRQTDFDKELKGEKTIICSTRDTPFRLSPRYQANLASIIDSMISKLQACKSMLKIRDILLIEIANTDCQKMATDIIICFKIYEGTIRPRLLEAKRLKKIQ